jgi:hypothetical protein
MNFIKLKYLVYSSHKSSTQSVSHTLIINNFKTIHCHVLDNFKHDDFNKQKINFIEELEKYKQINKKKLKIISIIRNPIDRLLSSFFQSHHSDEIDFLKKNEANTTVSKLNEEELLELYIKEINTNTLHGKKESLDELSEIFEKNIINELKKMDNYYYYTNNLIELYVLDFKKIIDNNCLEYINKCLNLNIKRTKISNLSSAKSYYNKYKNIKNKISNETKNIIQNNYNKFYFEAFN